MIGLPLLRFVLRICLVSGLCAGSISLGKLAFLLFLELVCILLGMMLYALSPFVGLYALDSMHLQKNGGLSK